MNKPLAELTLLRVLLPSYIELSDAGVKYKLQEEESFGPFLYNLLFRSSLYPSHKNDICKRVFNSAGYIDYRGVSTHFPEQPLCLNCWQPVPYGVTHQTTCIKCKGYVPYYVELVAGWAYMHRNFKK